MTYFVLFYMFFILCAILSVKYFFKKVLKPIVLYPVMLKNGNPKCKYCFGNGVRFNMNDIPCHCRFKMLTKKEYKKVVPMYGKLYKRLGPITAKIM